MQEDIDADRRFTTTVNWFIDEIKIRRVIRMNFHSLFECIFIRRSLLNG